MTTGNKEKLNKLLEKVGRLIEMMEANQDLLIHERIDQFYYMERAEELKVLAAQICEFERSIEVFQGQIVLRYEELVTRWSKDVRWLTQHLRHQEKLRA